MIKTYFVGTIVITVVVVLVVVGNDIVTAILIIIVVRNDAVSAIVAVIDIIIVVVVTESKLFDATVVAKFKASLLSLFIKFR